MDKNFDERTYAAIEIDRLMVFAMHSLLRNGEECTFERLVKECFTLFPKSFSLFRYPQWPDSNKLDRPLRKLREKGWIIGSPKIGFTLTRFGEKIASEVDHQLKGAKVTKGVAPKRLKGREMILINYIKESDAYKRFINDKGAFSLTEGEFRSLLRCTLETPPRVVKQNLILCKKLAEQCNESGILEFLDVCGEKEI